MSMKGKKAKQKKAVMTDISPSHLEIIKSTYRNTMEYFDRQCFSEAILELKAGIKELNRINSCYFDEIFQLIIWMNELKHPEVSGYVIEGLNLYYLCGYASVELGDCEQAERYFHDALKLNPCNVDARFELIQLLIHQGDFEAMRIALEEVHRYIYKPEDLARLYRNYGWMFTEQQAWDAAIAVYFFSCAFADDAGIEKAENELGYIRETSGIEIVEPEIEEIASLAEKYHFPLGPDERILNLASENYQKYKGMGEDGLAEYFMAIYSGFVDEEEKYEDEDADISEKDLEEYLHVMEFGNLDETRTLADRYAYGDGLPQSFGKAENLYKRCLDLGDADALYALGKLYEMAQDYERATSTLKQVADNSDSKYRHLAERSIGGIYTIGNFVDFDLNEALHWLELAGRGGDATSFHIMGNIYRRGSNDFPPDMAQAFACYKKAAELGDARSILTMGIMSANGEGVPQSFDNARKFYTQALESGEKDSLFFLGELYYLGNGGEEYLAKAFEYYQRASNESEEMQRRAKFMLGQMYHNGEHVPADFQKGMKYYKEAAEMGDLWALQRLGEIYSSGEDGQLNPNLKKAIKYYQRGAKAGNVDSMLSLANMYLTGDGIKKNYLKAKEWYERAAEMRNASAMTSLGFIYSEGQGVQQDCAKAIEWYERAIKADEPDPQAMMNLGWMYALGKFVVQDLSKAEMLFSQAREFGHEDAQAALDQLHEAK